jgi:hypothetical protein
MKNTLLSITGMMIISLTAGSQTLLNEPQKAVVDATHNRLLVSNFATGDIIQIDNSGTQSYFVKEAGFVDGMEIVGDVVYGIGNNGKVLAYHLGTNAKVMDVTIPGTADDYLSSIASDGAGCLFISCPNQNTIYRMNIRTLKWWVFAKNNGLNRPNGILLEREKNRIVVIDDSKNVSLIHAISLKDSTVTTMATTSFNSPDGIVKDKGGNYYVGGYYLPGIYKIDPEFKTTPELFYKGSTMVYPTYDQATNSLLVTFYGTDSWGRIPLNVQKAKI